MKICIIIVNRIDLLNCMIFRPDNLYKVKNVKVNNVSIGSFTSYQFIAVKSDQYLSVEFVKDSPIIHKKHN